VDSSFGAPLGGIVTAHPPHSLKVHVDRDKCQGHNRCFTLAPELFDVDDLGTSFERGDGAVPGDLVDKARRAVANCPEYAISISEIGAAR
jgi:ferredoxin